jgi:putative iron-only hydrogenase system regulator
MKRLGIIAIIVKSGNDVTPLEVQKLLSSYSKIIIGRMGIPDRESGYNAISVIVKGNLEDISALSGKLGKLENVSVKSALTSVEIE